MCPGAGVPHMPPMQALLMPGKPPHLYLFLFLLLPPLVVESRAEFRVAAPLPAAGKVLPPGSPRAAEVSTTPRAGDTRGGDTCQMNPD